MGDDELLRKRIVTEPSEESDTSRFPLTNVQLALVIMLVIMAVAAGLSRSCTNSHAHTLAQYRQVQVGMTFTQVVHILGTGRYDWGLSQIETGQALYMNKDGSYIGLTFHDGILTGKAESGL
jgi:hypothetical protein